MPPRAIYFDAVGTLIHPAPSAATVYTQVGKRYGSKLDDAIIRQRFLEAFARQEAVDAEQRWRTSEERELQRWRTIVAEVLDDVTDAERCFGDLYEHFAQPASWACDQDAERMLAELVERGCRLGLASNYDRRLRQVAAGLGPLRRIRQLVISSEVGWRKPSPHFFAAVSDQAGVPADEILFVGDDLAGDYHGARAAGMTALLLAPAADPGIHTIGRLDELLAVLPEM